MVSKQKNNYAFIDSQNLNLGVQKFGWKLDWRKFRKLLQDEYGVTKAYLFVGYLPEFEDLYTQMHEAGYLVVLKPTIEMYAKPVSEEDKAALKEKDGEVEKKHPTKGNVDAELVLYAMKELPNYDRAVIVSGDGDFFCLVEYLAEQEKLLHLMAPNRMYSTLLKPYERFVVRVDSHKRQVEYYTHKKSKGKSGKGASKTGN